MTKQIDHITIYVKDKGFTLSATQTMIDGKRQPTLEHAYSNLMDLQTSLSELLDPQQERVLVSGVDFLDGGEMPGDDGWREWSGELLDGRDYPPGLNASDHVLVRLQNSDRVTTTQAFRLDWRHHQTGLSSIVAYKVLPR